MDAPGASAADSELRVALRLVTLLSEMGFFAGPADDAEPRPGVSYPMADVV